MKTEIPGGFTKAAYALAITGILISLIGAGISNQPAHQLFTSLHINGLFFTGIGLFGTFFIALSYAAGAAWNVSLFRILEGISRILPVGLAMEAIVIVCGILHIHHIFHWMEPDAHNDPLIQWKSPYLNIPFFIIRFIIIASIWLFFNRYFIQLNHKFTRDNSHSHYNRARAMSGLYLLLIVITAPVAAWDWLLSIDTHWFSTIFGWYVFASWWASGLSLFAILTVFLRRTPSFSFIRKEHFHDIGKWVFAVALVWCYAWFFQFMLIWYAHIPEEITYFQPRTREYAPLFWGIFAINFFVPFFLLMDRDAKRNPLILGIVSLLLLIGHWLNTYLSVVPGVYGTTPPSILLDIGIGVLVAGISLLIIKRYIESAPVFVEHHPLMEESLVYHSDAR